MKKTFCGVDCSQCSEQKKCHGCQETNGSPFGGICIAAEYIKVGGMPAFQAFNQQLIEEINALKVEGMPKVKRLFCLRGSYVNLSYPLPSGQTVQFLKDENIYLGAQLECHTPDGEPTERCFGVVADASFILIVTYGGGGADPELVLYKHR